MLLDLSWVSPTIPVIIGVIVGALIQYLASERSQKKRKQLEKRNLLIAIKTEIEIIIPIIEQFHPHQSGSQSSVYFATIIHDTPKIYPTGGLYYNLNRDIFSLPGDLSSKIFDFYISAIEAENYREFIVANPASPLLMMHISALCKSMIKINALIPELLALIDKELK